MKKLTINVSNKWFYTSLVLVFALILTLGVYAYTRPLPNPGHGADTVWVSVKSQEMTLQQAIDAGDLAGGAGLEYVGRCSISNAGQTQLETKYCKCNQGETVMVLDGKSAGVTGYCNVENQDSSNVRGACENGPSALQPSTGGGSFACFKYTSSAGGGAGDCKYYGRVIGTTVPTEVSTCRSDMYDDCNCPAGRYMVGLDFCQPNAIAARCLCCLS